ncbi:MAG: hypothetical protein V8S72_09380 [Oscillospiraceae bacterium]
MKQHGVLYPLKFEKACSRKDLRAFMLLYGFMKSGQILPIPNFIFICLSLKSPDLSMVSAIRRSWFTPFLRRFRMDLFIRSPA